MSKSGVLNDMLWDLMVGGTTVKLYVSTHLPGSVRVVLREVGSDIPLRTSIANTPFEAIRILHAHVNGDDE